MMMLVVIGILVWIGWNFVEIYKRELKIIDREKNIRILEDRIGELIGKRK